MPAAALVRPILSERATSTANFAPRLGIYPPVLQSPSLEPAKRNSTPAYEFKFLLSEAEAREVECRLVPHMAVDPHSDPEGKGYHITTLYCDTEDLDVFHRRGRHKLFKYRLRRYGNATRVYLERKSKRGEVVRKRRSALELELLSGLASGASALEGDAAWYRRQLVRNRMRPVCLIEYSRIAYFALAGEGPMRLTFDRSIAGALHREWSLEGRNEQQPLLSEKVVCEFKFRGAMPLLFKSAVQEMQLISCGVSKYRYCIDAAGIAVGSKASGSEPHA